MFSQNLYLHCDTKISVKIWLNKKTTTSIIIPFFLRVGTIMLSLNAYIESYKKRNTLSDSFGIKYLIIFMKYENYYFDHDLIKTLDHSRGEKQLYTSDITTLRSKNISEGAQRNPLKNVREQL